MVMVRLFEQVEQLVMHLTPRGVHSSFRGGKTVSPFVVADSQLFEERQTTRKSPTYYLLTRTKNFLQTDFRIIEDTLGGR